MAIFAGFKTDSLTQINTAISADNIQVNNLYIDSNNMSKETVLTVLLVGLVLIGVCSLVVYNIFYV